MKSRDFRDYLHDILESVSDIGNFVDDLSYEEFMKDRKTVNAVVRSIEVIGEAAKNIPEAIKAQHKGVPWKKMAAMRDKLIHGYFGVDNRHCGKQPKMT